MVNLFQNGHFSPRPSSRSSTRSGNKGHYIYHIIVSIFFYSTAFSRSIGSNDGIILRHKNSPLNFRSHPVRTGMAPMG